MTYESEPDRIAVDASDHVYVCNQDGIKRFDSHTGRLEAQTPSRSPDCAFGVTRAGQVYSVSNAGDRGPEVVSLSAKADRLRQDGIVLTPVPVDEAATFGVTDDGTIISAADSTIYRFARAPDGGLRWKSSVTSYASGPLNFVFIAIGRDDRVCGADLALDDGTTRILCFNRRDVGSVNPDTVIEGPHTGLAWINGLAIGQDDSVIALCTGSPDYIVRFAPGAHGDATPVATIRGPATGLKASDGVAIDGSGRIYASILGGLNTVDIYGPGASGDVAPEYQVRRSGDFDFQPGRIAVGRDGRIYIRSAASTIYVYEPVTTSSPFLQSKFQTRRLSSSLPFPGESIAVDGKGAVYADIGVDSIGRFEAGPSGSYGQTALLRPVENGVMPAFVATDPDDRLIILGDSGDAYDYGAPPSWQTARRIGFVSTIGPQIVTIAAGSAGAIYVASTTGNQIDELRPSKADIWGTMRTLAGPDTGLQAPGGMALDAKGDLFVANSRSNEISEYAPDPSGDARPIHAIMGGRTKLDHPSGVAIGNDGTIYVVNDDENPPRGSTTSDVVVTIYPPGSTGDAAPARTITFKQSVSAIYNGP